MFFFFVKPRNFRRAPFLAHPNLPPTYLPIYHTFPPSEKRLFLFLHGVRCELSGCGPRQNVLSDSTNFSNLPPSLFLRPAQRTFFVKLCRRLAQRLRFSVGLLN